MGHFGLHRQRLKLTHFNSGGRRESHAIEYLLHVTDICQLIIIWGEVQLFLCMQVNTIILCFIMYGYSCAHIWLLLCQHYVTLTQLLFVTCSVVYRVLIAHAKIFCYMVTKRNLSLISSIKTHSIAFSPSLLLTQLLIFLLGGLCNDPARPSWWPILHWLLSVFCM